MSVDPALAAHYMLARKESELRAARAHIRHLEEQTGASDDADGRYWLAKTCLFEHLHHAALQAVRSDPGLIDLAAAADAIDALQAPACRDGDHQVAA